MKSIYKHACKKTLAAAVCLAASGQIWAQQLEEIVVEAERRQTDLQDTPLAITAVSAEEIEQLGVEDLRELAQFVPNLTITPYFAYGNGAPNITMRGIGAGGLPQFGVATDRAVGIYIDGIYYSRNPGSLMSLAETAQVEVLRGPQGTLFGRNTTGGAIAYRTNKASTEGFEGYVDLAAGSYNERNYKAGVNIPLSDDWAMRIAYADLNRDGYIKRGSKDYGNVDTQVGRIAFRGEPTDKLTIDATISYNKSDTNGEAQEFVAFETNGAAIGRQILALSYGLEAQGEAPITENDPRLILGEGHLPNYCMLDDGNPYTIGELCDNYRKFDMTVLSFKATYDISDNISVSSLTGYLDGNSDQLTDAIFTGTYGRLFEQNWETFQQEFQVNFNYDRWNAVAGLIYYTEDAKEHEITREADVRFGRDPEVERARILAGIPVTRRNEYIYQETESIAIFSQLNYHLTDKLDVTAGLRYTTDKKDGRIEYFPDPVFEPTLDYANVSDDRDWDDIDWRLSFQYHINDDIMFYAAGSKAYKAGIMNDGSVETTISSGDPTIGFTDPEEVVSAEFGLRSEWFDNRLRFNVTYFDMDWGNRTGSTTVDVPEPDSPSDDCEDEAANCRPFFISINEPDVSTSGWEFDATLAITDSLTLTASYANNDVKQKGDPNFVLSGTADENWNLGLMHTYEFSSGATLSSSLSYAWTGSTYTFDQEEGSEDEPNINPDYEFTSGRITYAAASGKWSVAVFGQNLLDEEISYGSWSLGFIYGGFGTDPIQEYRARPRTGGVQFRYNF